VLLAACGGSGGAKSGSAIAHENGCHTCHRLDGEGDARIGGDLTRIGAERTKAQLRRALLRPPSGMPAYEKLEGPQLDALVDYLAAQR
jgi:mono/diheme cytochrome c family protein